MKAQCTSCSSKLPLLRTWITGKTYVTCYSCGKRARLRKKQMQTYAGINGGLVGALSTAVGLFLLREQTLGIKIAGIICTGIAVSVAMFYLFSRNATIEEDHH